MRKQETEQDSRRSFLTQPHRWSFIPFQQRKGIGIKQGNRSALSSTGVWSDLSGHGGRRGGEAFGRSQRERFPTATRRRQTRFVLIHSSRTANLAGSVQQNPRGVWTDRRTVAEPPSSLRPVFYPRSTIDLAPLMGGQNEEEDGSRATVLRRKTPLLFRFFPVLSPRCCPTHSQSLWPTGWPRNNLTFPTEDMVWLHFARPFLYHTHFPPFFFFSFSWKQKRQKSNAKIDQWGTRNQVSLFHLNRWSLLLPAFIVTSNENDKLMG